MEEVTEEISAGPARDEDGKHRVRVSYSEIKAFRDCQLKHWLSYRHRQTPERTGRAADLGTRWHKMQQRLFETIKAGGSVEDAVADMLAEDLNPNAAGSYDELEKMAQLRWMLDGWLQVYPELIKGHRVLSVEQELVFPLPEIHPHVRFYLKVLADVVTAHNGYLWVWDHKSVAKRAGNEKDMDFDDQSGLYLAGYAQTSGMKVGGGIWSYAVTEQLKRKERTLDERFWQLWHRRTEPEMRRILLEAAQTALDAYRRPLAVEPVRSPNPDHCRWMCDHRAECFYARKDDRPVFLRAPFKPDQLPQGAEFVGE